LKAASPAVSRFDAKSHVNVASMYLALQNGRPPSLGAPSKLLSLNRSSALFVFDYGYSKAAYCGYYSIRRNVAQARSATRFQAKLKLKICDNVTWR